MIFEVNRGRMEPMFLVDWPPWCIVRQGIDSSHPLRYDSRLVRKLISDIFSWFSQAAGTENCFCAPGKMCYFQKYPQVPPEETLGGGIQREPEEKSEDVYLWWNRQWWGSGDKFDAENSRGGVAFINLMSLLSRGVVDCSKNVEKLGNNFMYVLTKNIREADLSLELYVWWWSLFMFRTNTINIKLCFQNISGPAVGALGSEVPILWASDQYRSLAC